MTDWPHPTPVDALASRAAAAPAPARVREPALVPPSAVSSRALVMVIVIMSFLASLAAGSAVLVERASRQWSEGVAREASVQIRAKPGVDLDGEAARVAALVRAVPGVLSLHVFSRAESERLLEPWLGQNLDFDDLPVPRLIVAVLDRGDAGVTGAIRAVLAKDAPTATFDDHRAWSDRLTTMGRTIVGVALVLLALILLAMALAVAFATSGAMAGSREIVDVLHFVGASDAFISRQYQRQFLLFGLQGGCGGALGACLAFLVAGRIARAWVATAGGAQVEALFGTFDIGPAGYACTLLVALMTTAIVVLTSRFIVGRQLRALA